MSKKKAKALPLEIKDEIDFIRMTLEARVRKALFRDSWKNLQLKEVANSNRHEITAEVKVGDKPPRLYVVTVNRK